MVRKECRLLISDWQSQVTRGSSQSAIGDLQSKTKEGTHPPFPRTRTPVHHCILGLMGDKVREKVGENAKQRQSRQAICREHPCSAAFMLDRGRCGRRRVGGRDNRGPIFHAQTSSGKIVAQVNSCVTPARRRSLAGPAEAHFTPVFSGPNSKM